VVDPVQLQALLEQLNLALAEVTPYKLAIVPPGEIEPVEKNAHYMPKRVYDQLLANIRTDKNLSSLPFCWRKPDGVFVVLSGNHRVELAVKAGVPLILVLYTDRALSRSEQLGIQLSHNALVGEDNPALLRELWTQIDDLDYKIYSGLDEEVLKTYDRAKIIRLVDQPLRFEELRILFLSPEIERIGETLKRLGAANKTRLAARYEDFDRFFETLLKFKEASGIMNTATAFMAIAEIVEDWLERHHPGTT